MFMVGDETWELFVVTLTDPKKRENFEKFLESEHSDENIRFWIEAEEYEKLEDEQERKNSATRIWTNFLAYNAKNSISMGDTILGEIEKSIETNQFSQTLFHSAKDYVFSVMYEASFFRFLNNGSISHAFEYKLNRTASSLPKALLRRFLNECRNVNDPWKDLGIRRGVHLFHKRNFDSPFECAKGIGLVTASITQIRTIVMALDESRKEWDQHFDEGEILERVSENTDITWIKLKDLKLTRTFSERRDLVIHRTWNKLPDGSVIILLKSLPQKYPETKGIIRAELQASGWFLEDVEEGCLVTFLNQIDYKCPVKGTLKNVVKDISFSIYRIQKMLEKHVSHRSSTPLSKEKERTPIQRGASLPPKYFSSTSPKKRRSSRKKVKKDLKPETLKDLKQETVLPLSVVKKELRKSEKEKEREKKFYRTKNRFPQSSKNGKKSISNPGTPRQRRFQKSRSSNTTDRPVRSASSSPGRKKSKSTPSTPRERLNTNFSRNDFSDSLLPLRRKVLDKDHSDIFTQKPKSLTHVSDDPIMNESSLKMSISSGSIPNCMRKVHIMLDSFPGDSVNWHRHEEHKKSKSTPVTPSRLSPSRGSPSRVSSSRVSPTRMSLSQLSPSRVSPTRMSPTWGSTSGDITEDDQKYTENSDRSRDFHRGNSEEKSRDRPPRNSDKSLRNYNISPSSTVSSVLLQKEEGSVNSHNLDNIPKEHIAFTTETNNTSLFEGRQSGLGTDIPDSFIWNSGPLELGNNESGKQGYSEILVSSPLSPKIIPTQNPSLFIPEPQMEGLSKSVPVTPRQSGPLTPRSNWLKPKKIDFSEIPEFPITPLLNPPQGLRTTHRISTPQKSISGPISEIPVKSSPTSPPLSARGGIQRRKANTHLYKEYARFFLSDQDDLERNSSVELKTSASVDSIPSLNGFLNEDDRFKKNRIYGNQIDDHLLLEVILYDSHENEVSEANELEGNEVNELDKKNELHNNAKMEDVKKGNEIHKESNTTCHDSRHEQNQNRSNEPELKTTDLTATSKNDTSTTLPGDNTNQDPTILPLLKKTLKSEEIPKTTKPKRAKLFEIESGNFAVRRFYPDASRLINQKKRSYDHDKRRTDGVKAHMRDISLTDLKKAFSVDFSSVESQKRRSEFVTGSKQYFNDPKSLESNSGYELPKLPKRKSDSKKRAISKGEAPHNIIKSGLQDHSETQFYTESSHEKL